MTSPPADTAPVLTRAKALLDASAETTCRRTDRAFAGLMVFQWLGGIILALALSPYAWTGEGSRVHEHVWAAVFLGGIIATLPVVLAWKMPGRVLTRHVIAAGQMLAGALLIHLTGGRIETHFHVFGSLAFLAFYRDPRVLVTATFIVIADHFVRGCWWPQSIYGALTHDFWRTIEHAAWVVFEDVFLLISIRQAQRETRKGALHQARVEQLGAEFEQRVIERTSELQASQEQLRIHDAALTAAANGIAIIDVHGCIEWGNPALSRLTGYPLDELIGRNPRIFKSGRHPREFYQNLWDTISAGNVWEGELVNRRNDGTLYIEEMTISPVHDSSGKISRYVAVKQDISARKKSELAVTAAHEAAVETARLKSEFIANMSHELRTPMNGVIGMLNLVSETSLSAEQHDCVETARTCAESLLRVLNDVLDFSKIEARKMDIEEVDFDLRELVEGALDTLADRAQKKGLELAGMLSPGTPTALRGDPGRLRQVLLNIVGNAIKFTERGEVAVRVHVESGPYGSLLAFFEVRDTGIGIAPDIQRSLFQAFTQADGTATRKYGGLGMGLALSSRLIELMHGEIHVKSKPGAGSVFTFTARLNRGQEIDLPLSPGTGLNGCRVLIVDDNAVNRTVLHHQVATCGMRDTLAAGGSEALQLLRTAASDGTPFQLALLDLKMPGMDGIELARAIKADPLLAGTRVIVLSSLGMRVDDEIRNEAGIDDCLFKPVRLAKLIGCMTRSVSAGAAAGRT